MFCLLTSSIPLKTKKINYILLIYLSVAPNTYIKSNIQFVVGIPHRKESKKTGRKAHKRKWTGHRITYLPGRGLWAITKAQA